MQVSYRLDGHKRHGVTQSISSVGRRANSEDPADRLIILREHGYSVRQIAYMLDMSRATVGDALKRRHNSLPEPIPFYRLTTF